MGAPRVGAIPGNAALMATVADLPSVIVVPLVNLTAVEAEKVLIQRYLKQHSGIVGRKNTFRKYDRRMQIEDRLFLHLLDASCTIRSQHLWGLQSTA